MLGGGGGWGVSVASLVKACLLLSVPAQTFPVGPSSDVLESGFHFCEFLQLEAQTEFPLTLVTCSPP